MADLLEDEEFDPALQDWQPMAPEVPITAALQPRKPLDVAKGAPSALQPQRGMGGKQDSDGIDALRQAMAQAQQNRLGAELGMAGETISRAFVPQQQTSGFWQRQLESADRPVQELMAQQKTRGAAEDRALKERGIAAVELGKKAYAERLAQEGERQRIKAEEDQAKKDYRHPAQAAARERWRKAFPALAETLGDTFETATMDELSTMQGLLTKAAKAAEAGKPSEMTPYQRQSLGLRSRELTVKEQRTEADRAAKEASRVAAAEEKRIENEAKTTGKLKADVTQVETFGQNILRNLDRLEEMVGPTGPGTFSATGPDSRIMGALIKGIAVDSAKLADPGSVAREGEVAMEQSKLWDPGSAVSSLSLTNETARKLLQDYRQRVKDRIKTAYDVRGLGGRQGGSPAPTGGTVRMKFPSGAVRDVPADQVERATREKGAVRE